MAAMGKESGLPQRLPEEDERFFPNLVDYSVASPADATYNCIAFAAGDTTRKWDPGMVPNPGYYWPPAALRESGNNDIEALRRAFAELGFETCDNGDVEEGYRKIALYAVNAESWQHAAIQSDAGEWLSKLGDSYDIRHKSPHCFVGSIYGNVICFMRKRINGTPR
jgi:hypothetical protein